MKVERKQEIIQILSGSSWDTDLKSAGHYHVMMFNEMMQGRLEGGSMMHMPFVEQDFTYKIISEDRIEFDGNLLTTFLAKLKVRNRKSLKYELIQGPHIVPADYRERQYGYHLKLQHSPFALYDNNYSETEFCDFYGYPIPGESR
jgi:hypothetical protein